MQRQVLGPDGSIAVAAQTSDRAKWERSYGCRDRDSMLNPKKNIQRDREWRPQVVECGLVTRSNHTRVSKIDDGLEIAASPTARKCQRQVLGLNWSAAMAAETSILC